MVKEPAGQYAESQPCGLPYQRHVHSFFVAEPLAQATFPLGLTHKREDIPRKLNNTTQTTEVTLTEVNNTTRPNHERYSHSRE